MPQTLYSGGPILSVNDSNDVVEAVLVEDGAILAAGALGEVEQQARDHAVRVDLSGRTMIPGFIDPHGHFPDSGILALWRVNLAAPPLGDCMTVDMALERLADRVARTPKGEWVIGGMYDQLGVAERRFTTRDELDALSRDHPIYVAHFTGHAGATNSLGLAYRGIDENSKDPRGGRFGRDPGTGRLDGLLDGMTAMGELGDTEFQITTDRFKAAFKTATQEYLAQGVTMAQNAWAPESMLRFFAAVAEDGDTDIDVMVLPAAHMEPRLTDGALDFSIPEGRGIMLGPRKLFSDGSLHLQTACISEPYFKSMTGDPGHCGKLSVTHEGMTRHVGALHDMGYQVHVHANGDAAADLMMDVFETVLEANPRDDHRHTLIHCQNYRDDQLDRMVKLGLTPSFFAAHIHYFGDMHCEVTFGPERTARMCATRSAADRGLRFTIHNDASVTPTLPLHLLWCAVNRTTVSGRVLGIDQAITAQEALRAHTIDAAWQVFREHERGSIEPSKRADFAILSANPLDNPATIRDIVVEETILKGKSVYRRR
jgi:predicted amidohydrolase YtcJ